MKSFLKVIIFIEIISIIKSDWIKISQDSIPPNMNKDISTISDTDYHLSSILDKEQKTEKPPSQEWLNYQKLRFSVGENTQKIIVTDTVNLKNSVNPNIQNNTKFSEYINNNNNENSQKFEDIEVKKFHLPVQKIDNFHTQENVNLNKSLISEKTIDVEQKFPKRNNKDYGKQIKFKNSKLQTPSFSGFLAFLKSMQLKLISNTANGIKDKINKLSELRDKLLLNIEDRIMTLWSVKETKRSKRGILEDSQSHFPSAETALMTINFLTFAVFLIKLVLQVIKTIKSKHYNFNGFTVNTMESMKLSNSRKNARHFGDSQHDIENAAKILRSIDSFNN